MIDFSSADKRLRTVPFRSQGQLLKHQLAAKLREEILAGRLMPGDAVVETQLAPKLGVAQASIREAINILISEGFIEKEHGKSARVIQMTEEAVQEAYRVRAVLEGLAARLVVESGAEPSGLETALEAMNQAVGRGDLRGVIEKDLTFHLELARLSGSRLLERHLRQILVPLFAFTLIRATKLGAPVQAWGAGSDGHRLIVKAIRSGDPVFAEQTAIYAVREFAGVASVVWAHGARDATGKECAPLWVPGQVPS